MRIKNSLFMKYLLTYMVVNLVTILLFGVFIYSENINEARDGIIKEFKTSFNSMRSNLDNQLYSIYDLSVILQAKKDIKDCSQILDIQPGYVSTLNSISLELQPYSYTDSFINELILYFPLNGIFVSSKTVGLYPGVFYEVVLGYKHLNYSQWRSQIIQRQFMNYYTYKDSRTDNQYIDIYHDLPLSKGIEKITMIVRIDAKETISGLDHLLQNGAIVLLADNEGNIIYSSSLDDYLPSALEMQKTEDGQIITLNNNKYFVLADRMESIQWQYMIFIPENLFLKEERQIIQSMVIHFMSILVAGAVMAIAFSFYNTIPVKRLLRSLSLNSDYKLVSVGNEYNTLDNYIQNLMKNNQQLKSEMNKRIEHIKIDFIERLIRGNFTSLDEIRTTAEYAGLTIDYKYYIVAVLELPGYSNEINSEFIKEMDMTLIVINNIIQNNVSRNVLVYKNDFKKIVMIYCLDETASASTVYDNVKFLMETVNKNLNIRLRCAISNEVNDISYVSAAYYSLVSQLRNSDTLPHEQIVFMENIQVDSYFYPIDIENKLLNYIKSGNSEEAKNILSYLFSQNQEKFMISIPGTLYFIYALKCTFIRAKNEIKLEGKEENDRFDFIIYLNKDTDLSECFHHLNELIDILCSSVNERKTKRNKELIEAINDFIRVNYSNIQLSLSMIASKFMMTENYISFFYKKETGQNISNFIEATRLEKAYEKLGEGKETVKDIAFSVGYTNINTFYKAFKRYFGTSPRNVTKEIQLE